MHAECARLGQTRAQARALARQPTHAEPQSAAMREHACAFFARGNRRRHTCRDQCGDQRRGFDNNVQACVQLAHRTHEIEARFKLARGDQRAQVGPAATIERQQQHARGECCMPRCNSWRRCRIECGELGAGQRSETRGPARLEETHRQIQIVAIGERERGVPALGRALG